MQKKAIIFGANGQDGFYLTKLLLDKNYEIISIFRDISNINIHYFNNFISNVKAINVNHDSYDEINNVILYEKPDEIYNLAGQSSVGKSYTAVIDTFKSTALLNIFILESIRNSSNLSKYFHASSSEIFGDHLGNFIDENSFFMPNNPYGISKLSATNIVDFYRNNFNLYCVNGYLFNHESPMRSINFVTKKIVNAASLIKLRKLSALYIGNINIFRDWGWAPDYVRAMWLMMQHNTPQNYIIATGKSVSLEYYIKNTFDYFDLDWRNHVVSDVNLYRPSEPLQVNANPNKAKIILNWIPTYYVENVIEELCKITELEHQYL